MKISKNSLLCLIGAGLSASAVALIFSITTSNIFLGILAVIFYWFYHNQIELIKCRGKIFLTSGGIGCLFAFFMMLNGLERFDDYPEIGMMGKLAMIVCIFLGFAILFTAVIIFLYRKMMFASIYTENKKSRKSYPIFLIGMVLILLCWLPYYLANYPGIIISDSLDQIGQALSGIYSNHHPVVQTWMIQGIFQIGMKLFQSLNACVALYCILQMFVLAVIYAYTVCVLYQQGVKQWVCVIAVLFYAIMPYNVMFSFNMWKDSLFSAFVLLFTVCLWKAIVELKENVLSIKILDTILLVISGLGMCLFRNNGFYAFILVLPFVCILLWKSKKYLVFGAVGILLMTLLVKGPLFQYFHVSNPDTVESLSIPLQQIARVVSEEEELTLEQKNLLEQVVNLEEMKAVYDSRISDPVKNLIRSQGNQAYFENHKKEYLKLWIELGLQYPSQYLRAYIQQTEGYWNPAVQYWVYTDGIYPNRAGIESSPILSGNQAQTLNWFAWDTWDKIPLYGILWNTGSAVWMTIFLAGFCFVMGKKRELIIFLPIFAIWATLLVATPVYAEFRYIYAIFLCMPIYIAVCKETKVDII